jgi:hypothetical protein
LETLPLVLLDVDGVINDIDLVGVRTNLWETEIIHSHGYDVAVPSYMPRLIQGICSVAEVHWCTTWRDRANDDIARYLGIGPLPVVDDGTTSRYVDWKAAAAYDLADSALQAGRRVLWIEDFYGDPPTKSMPAGTEFADTADNDLGAVLRPHDLPQWLTQLLPVLTSR